MTLRPRLTPATSGAEIQPRAPLTQPVILWDSRSWDGSIGPGTGGIPNEGTAGPAFDLDVRKYTLGLGITAYGAMRGPGPNPTWVSPGGVDWDDLGGPPCDGPFTMILAIGSFPRQPIQGVDGGLDCEVLFRATSGSPIHFAMQQIWFNGFGDDPSGTANMETGADVGGFDYPIANYGMNGFCPGCTEDYLRQRLLVMTMDGVDGGATYWRNFVPVAPEIDFVDPVPPTTPETFYVGETFGNCAAGSSSSPINTHELFVYFGEHRGFGDIVPGTAWNGAIGFVLLRGEPTPDEIAYWDDYFFTGYTPWESPLAYIGGQAIRADDTYVYHVFTSSGTGLTPIPGVTLPTTVDVFVVAGGGEGEDSISTDPAGGGAGGEAILTTGHPAPTSAALMNIGSGGAGFNVDGTNSIYDFTGPNTLTAVRGRAGGSVALGRGGLNGSHGGGTPNGQAGGGGAGATGAGQNAPSTTQGGNGGPGVLNNWRTGSNELYGLGGGGAGPAPAVTPGSPGWVTPHFGGGGTGSGWPLQSERQGRQGIIIVRYPRVT